jgi:hypothetical protein
MKEDSLNPFKGLIDLVKDAPMTTLFCLSLIAMNGLEYHQVYQNEKLLRRLEASEKNGQYSQYTNNTTYATIIQKSR